MWNDVMFALSFWIDIILCECVFAAETISGLAGKAQQGSETIEPIPQVGLYYSTMYLYLQYWCNAIYNGYNIITYLHVNVHVQCHVYWSNCITKLTKVTCML